MSTEKNKAPGLRDMKVNRSGVCLSVSTANTQIVSALNTAILSESYSSCHGGHDYMCTGGSEQKTARVDYLGSLNPYILTILKVSA